MGVKFSELTESTSPALTDILASVVSGNSRKITLANLKTALSNTLFMQTNDVTVTNSAAEGSFIGTGSGSVTIAANTMAVGKSYLIELRGHYSTKTSNPGTMTIRAKLGATTIVSATAPLDSNVADGGYFRIIMFGTVRTIGSTGTIMFHGAAYYSDAASANTMHILELVPLAATTIDTTASNAFDVTGQFSVASADNTVHVTNCILELK